jgi:hypothetical protein
VALIGWLEPDSEFIDLSGETAGPLVRAHDAWLNPLYVFNGQGQRASEADVEAVGPRSTATRPVASDRFAANAPR